MKQNDALLTVRDRLFDAAWILLIASQLISLTAAYALSESSLKVTLYKGAAALSCLLCLAVIVLGLVKRLYSAKIIICYIVLGAVFLLSWYYSKESLLIWTFLICAASMGINSKRALGISAVLTAAVLFFTVLAAETGLTTNYLFGTEEMVRLRYGLGFVWASVAPTLLFFFALQYIFLRKSLMKPWEYIILAAADVYLYIRTDTNLPFFLMIAFLLFFAVCGMFKNHWRILAHLRWLYVALPALVCASSITVYMLFNPDSSVWMKINTLLSDRLYLGEELFDRYGATLFGQKIEWAGNAIRMLSSEYNYIDCSYMRILINFGIVFVIAAIFIYTLLIVKASGAGDYWLVFIALVIIVHSFSEPRLMDIAFNVFPAAAFMRMTDEPLRFSAVRAKKSLRGEAALNNAAQRESGKREGDALREDALSNAEQRESRKREIVAPRKSGIEGAGK